MLNNKNVSFNHTLEEYKRKYGNSTKLKKVTKLEVDKNSSLLDHKHWWFINNTYYEVPAKKNIVAWWSALPKAAQIAACAIAGVGVVSAVVFPTLSATVWNKGGKPVEPIPTRKVTIDESVSNVSCTSTLVNENLEITLIVDSGYKITEISSITINGKALEKTEYTFADNKITISKDVLSANKGDVIVKPAVEEIIPIEDYLMFNTTYPYNRVTIKPEAITSGRYPKDIKIPKSMLSGQTLTDITGVHSFGGLTNLISIDLSEATEIKYIGGYGGNGFKDCTNLKRIKLNDGWLGVGNSGFTSFRNCSSLEEITIPSSVTCIPAMNATQANFAGCTNLKTVTVDCSYVANFNGYEDGSVDPASDESLYVNATTVYIKNDINLGTNSYVYKNFNKQGTSDKEGYFKYLRK